MTNKALIPVEQKTVPFYDDELIAVRANDGNIYVSVRHMCEALGLTQRGQVLRIQRHTILNEGYKGGIKLITPGGRQPMGVLRVDLVPLWLSGVRTTAIKDENTKNRLERYQREAAQVLWEAFQAGRLTSEPTFEQLLKRETDAVEAYKLIEAMLKLARSHVLLEARMDDYEIRLETIETQLGNPDHLITNAQAERISQAVKAVALELGRRSGKNEHGGVYGEVYRTFSITSYKELPATRYDDCIKMLTDWYESLTDNVIF